MHTFDCPWNLRQKTSDGPIAGNKLSTEENTTDEMSVQEKERASARDA
jgi:hypothetical protein